MNISGLWAAIWAAVVIAALMTLGDFLWARFISAHRAVWGLLHGAALCLGMGGFLGLVRGRAPRGALGGVVVGLGAAAGYYVLAPALGQAAMLVAWAGLWLGLAFLDARGLGSGATSREALVRGALAAAGSGLAFYAVSGIWTRPRPGGPDYAYHFACWTLAFLPGFLALLGPRPRRRQGV
jgi:hypothetical protein